MDNQGSPTQRPGLFKVTSRGQGTRRQLRTTSPCPGGSVWNHPLPTNSYIPMDCPPENRSRDGGAATNWEDKEEKVVMANP